MFPTLLLASGSLVCLVLSLSLLFMRRAFDAALLQKENWLGYALLSAALGIAGWRGFVTFSHAYELSEGQTLAVHWRLLLGNEAVPLLYGLFALMVAGYALWRRTRPLPFSRRRMVAEGGLLAVSLGVLTFGCFAWPTPWAYTSWTPVQMQEMQNEAPSLITVQGLGIVAEYRENRLNGRREAKWQGRWYPMDCGVDTCWRSKNGAETPLPP
ncbi:MAG: hypothetical protein M3Y13_07840 [Armatimonadota bacterium]|nr:hypothetical protein [Armatimonadota bacterium]